jgi:hypothetical protein
MKKQIWSVALTFAIGALVLGYSIWLSMGPVVTTTQTATAEVTFLIVCPPVSCPEQPYPNYAVGLTTANRQAVTVAEDVSKQMVESGIGLHQQLRITYQKTTQYNRRGIISQQDRVLTGWSK